MPATTKVDLDMTAQDVEKLDMARVFNVLDAVNRMMDIPGVTVAKKLDFRAEVEKGLPGNKAAQNWYEDALKVVLADAQRKTKTVWDGEGKEILTRRQKAVGQLEKKSPVFFQLRRMAARDVDALYKKRGLLSMQYFRDARFEASLFPRDLELRAMFNLHGEYSAPLENFKARVEKIFRAMPLELQEFMHESGYIVRIGNMLRDINPSYATDVIPGSAHERTFEQAAQGVHTTSIKAIDLPHSMPVSRNGRIRSIRAHGKNDSLRAGLPMTMRHEIGHAINIIMGHVANSVLVRTAYAEDLLQYPRTKVPSEEIEFMGLSHYLPVTHGGEHANIDNSYGEDRAREEALVETMAEFMLAKPDVMLMQQQFPELSKVAKFIWKHIQKDYAIYRAGYDYPSKENIEPVITELATIRPHI